MQENEGHTEPGYEEENDPENPENGFKDDDKQKEDYLEKEEESDDQLSPRGVLGIPISGSDSDRSCKISSCSCSNSFGSCLKEKSPHPQSLQDEKHGSQWKDLIGKIKRRSRRFSAISLLSGYELSAKLFNAQHKHLKKLWVTTRGSQGEIECGEVPLPKHLWKNFTQAELTAATDNFSPDKLIGKGGHAEVYKGCLSDGQVVAVKRITKQDKDDDDDDDVIIGDFLSELGIIAHVNHPNCGKLIGFSVDGGLHLVLQYSSHGNLAYSLHGSHDILNWKLRFKVAMGVAEGLRYLHVECPRRMIHRDITASNILLTEEFEPQICDFGLAKWLPEKWLHHVVSPIEGTFGYMAPEYFMHGIIDEKTDVFAFGVLLLELITGHRAVDSCRQSLVLWAKPLMEENNIEELVDPRLGEKYETIEMKRALLTASTCTHHLSSLRPNMNRATQMLRGEIGVELKQNKSMGGRAVMLEGCDLEDYTCTTYMNDLNRHMQLVMMIE